MEWIGTEKIKKCILFYITFYIFENRKTNISHSMILIVIVNFNCFIQFNDSITFFLENLLQKKKYV